MSLNCSQCHSKQTLITKYVKLIKLLKAKCEKTTRSSIKSQILAFETCLQTSQQGPASTDVKIPESMTKQCIKGHISLNQSSQTSKFQLALLIISNKSSKCLLKHTFNTLKSAAKISQKELCILPVQTSPFESLGFNLSDFLQNTLSYGQKLQNKNESNTMALKQLHSIIFNLELKNSQLLKINAKVQKLIQDSQKKYQKETQKKRQSLQTVAEEIRQKNDMVSELQQTIRRYQKILGKSSQKIRVQNVLIQDEQDLKKTCLRLQNINEKLNCDLRTAESSICLLNTQLKRLKTQNQTFKFEIKIIKQQNFDFSEQIIKNGELRHTYSSLCQKLTKKIEKLRLKQKQMQSSMKMNPKCCQLFCSRDIVSSKNTEASQESPLSRKQSLKELDAEQKIEQIFSYLFNIQDEHYKVMNEQIFDQDELDLLRTHKNSYLNNLRVQNHQAKIKTEKIMKTQDLNQTDQIIYLQSQYFQNSFFDALQHKSNKNIHGSPDAKAVDKLKLLNLEIQKSKLIQKVLELKNLHMHIRNVFLNFLKTLDLSASKTESQSIMQVIFEFFEYSEDQKLSICKQKRKKLWGIL